jgi:hypothetical protein
MNDEQTLSGYLEELHEKELQIQGDLLEIQVEFNKVKKFFKEPVKCFFEKYAMNYLYPEDDVIEKVAYNLYLVLKEQAYNNPFLQQIVEACTDLKSRNVEEIE